MEAVTEQELASSKIRKPHFSFEDGGDFWFLFMFVQVFLLRCEVFRFLSINGRWALKVSAEILPKGWTFRGQRNGQRA